MSNTLLIHASGLVALILNVVALVCTCERSLRLRSGDWERSRLTV